MAIDLAALRQTLAARLPALRQLRQDLHRHPELQHQEFRTRERLLAALGDSGLAVQPPRLRTDLVADLQVAPDRPWVCLRADMDALPITEVGDRPHRSQVPGVMHACGHDGHSSILAGAAQVLAAHREELPVNLRFVFQPAEENVCGGRDLVAAGILEGIDEAYALHGWPGLRQGLVSCREGAMFAAADFFELTVHGKAGHAAMPEHASNPLPVAGQLLANLADLHAYLAAEYGAVLTATTVAGGEANNIIPEAVRIGGTARYLQPDFGHQMKAALEEVAADTAEGTPCRIELRYQQVYRHPLINAAAPVAHVRACAEELAPRSYIEASEPTRGAEDFAFYLHERPGAMFWLGLGETWPGLHTPSFDFNDEVLETGALLFSLIALRHPA